jgi:hypothetical protein
MELDIKWHHTGWGRGESSHLKKTKKIIQCQPVSALKVMQKKNPPNKVRIK